MPIPPLPVRLRAVAAVVLAALAAGPAAAQNNGVARAGLIVPVPAPLTSEAVTRIKNRIEAARGRPDHRPAVVVFDFAPDDKDAAADDFGVCYGLARYVAGLHDVQTVAYVHRKTTGHLVLPVLTCKELAVGPGASLGEILGPAGGRLPPIEANAYAELLGPARAGQMAVVRKMADGGVQLRKGQTKTKGEWYYDLRDRDATEKLGVRVADTAPLAAAPDGKVGLFAAAQLRDFGLASTVVEGGRQDLAAAFGLGAAAFREDHLNGRPPVAFRYVMRGPVDGGVREAVRRVAEKVVRDRGNLLFLQLECGGGDLQAARDLAKDLLELQGKAGDDGLLVVAFVPDAAPDTAAAVALGCGEIVLSRRKDAAPAAGGDAPAEAEFGDFEAMLAKGGAVAQNPDAWAASLKELADAQGYAPLLIDGMLKRDFEIVRVHAKTDRTRKRLMTAAELEADKANWVADGVVKPRGQLLKLSATRAEELGLARAVVQTRDPAEVYARYGLDPAKVRDATPAWLDQFAAFLRKDAVTVLLVTIAFAGLILELKVPGTAVPGIVAALCFILVFWAHTQFSGQIAVLAGLLFLLGLVLILLEVFVLPGFGAAGIFGVLLMLGALALVTATQVPQTPDEWVSFAGRMAQYLFGLALGLTAALLVGRFLPNIPVANRLLLSPPEEEAGAADATAARAAALLGAVGVAVTVLRPAGSVRLGDDFVDVVTDGGYVPAGARVQVVEVEGNRVVVKEI